MDKRLHGWLSTGDASTGWSKKKTSPRFIAVGCSYKSQMYSAPSPDDGCINWGVHASIARLNPSLGGTWGCSPCVLCRKPWEIQYERGNRILCSSFFLDFAVHGQVELHGISRVLIPDRIVTKDRNSDSVNTYIRTPCGWFHGRFSSLSMEANHNTVTAT